MDGICSGAILTRYLWNFTDNVYCIYSQRDKGHGISNQRVPNGMDLLILIDSSTNDGKRCKELKEQGLDIIIIDHHVQTKENNSALIVNNQIDNYPNKYLSASGLIYKVIQVLDHELGTNYHENFIDLAGIGIYADVMSMRELENRYFVSKALKNIVNPGLKAIIKSNELTDLNSSTIGFTIAPVINAITRLGRIELAIELMLEDDYKECLRLAKICKKLNEERKLIENKIYDSIKDRINTSNNIIIAVNESNSIESGYLGLIATKIANNAKKPTLVVKYFQEEDMFRGSGRSFGSLKLRKFLKSTGLFDLLEGHEGAFGVAFKKDKLSSIVEIANKKLKVSKDSESTFEYDLEIDINDITSKLVYEIAEWNYLSGQDVPEARILVKDIYVEDRKVMGKFNDTIKLRNNRLDIIKFRTTSDFANDVVEKKINAIGSLSINKYYNWKERRNIYTNQMFLTDYKLEDDNCILG